MDTQIVVGSFETENPKRIRKAIKKFFSILFWVLVAISTVGDICICRYCHITIF